jgi:membrane dipeptidase
MIIDAHEDLGYASLCYQRDYRRSAADIRSNEKLAGIPGENGECLLGWPDYQQAQVGAIFSTIFIMPHRFNQHGWSKRDYKSLDEARLQYQQQFEFYRRLAGENPELFAIITNKNELNRVLTPWIEKPAQYPSLTHPVGLVLLMEGAEGVHDPHQLEGYWEIGLRIIGPVWGGGRYCGGMYEKGKFTREGFQFLDAMQSLGFALDITHMSEESSLQALDRYEGPVLASHANARTILKNPPNDRHLTDQAIHKLIERDGIIGITPYNKFLKPDWKPTDDRRDVKIQTLADHIDHICQLAGNIHHVGFGTDFDGGFGWPEVPLEINTIADLPKLSPILAERGFSAQEIELIMGGNWKHFLERTLPA